MSNTSSIGSRAIRQVGRKALEGIAARLEVEPEKVFDSIAVRRPRMRSLESTLPEMAGDIESAADRVPDTVKLAASRAIEKVLAAGPDAPLTRTEEIGLEAIVLVAGRPAILIQDGHFLPPPEPWTHLESSRERIEKVLKSVGRIELTGHPDLEWVGTGFLVGDGVVMTNRHVAKEFARREDGGRWVFEPGMAARIDYAEELGSTQSLEFEIQEVIGVHDVFDLALLRVSAGDGEPPNPLPLIGDKAAAKISKQVYLVGFPASDSRRNDPDVMRRIFMNIYDVKRLQPGEITGVQSQNSLLLHDCSTLGGNSGSCVVDLDTHRVLALHFSGRYGVANHAVQLAALAMDPLLLQAGVAFA